MTHKHNPNPHERPRVVSVEKCKRTYEPSPGERARMRATSVAQEQREARARREALALLERDDQARDARAFSVYPGNLREDLQAVKRRPLDAPMATFEDPTAKLAWDPKGYMPEVIPSLGIGRLVLTLILMAASFISGVATGRLL